MKSLSVGILSFHGDVAEHESALRAAAKKLRISLSIPEVRTKDDLKNLDGLILPGGESTTLEKLLRRAGMFAGLKKLPAIFGTCAGAILLSKRILGKAEGQSTLGLMDITTDRNAYGTQRDSFETDMQTEIGPMRGVFIRAPRIARTGKGVKVLARHGREIVACEERSVKRYYLAASFHPELTTVRFHEHFLRNLLQKE